MPIVTQQMEVVGLPSSLLVPLHGSLLHPSLPLLSMKPASSGQARVRFWLQPPLSRDSFLRQTDSSRSQSAFRIPCHSHPPRDSPQPQVFTVLESLSAESPVCATEMSVLVCGDLVCLLALTANPVLVLLQRPLFCSGAASPRPHHVVCSEQVYWGTLLSQGP